jgi:hypothetical protein
LGIYPTAPEPTPDPPPPFCELQINCRCVFHEFPRVETSRLIPNLLVFVEILLFPVLVLLLVGCMGDCSKETRVA